MVTLYFFYGLAFFSLGAAALLESRHATRLPLGRQLPWLAGFGIIHSLVEWGDMFRLLNGLQHLETLLIVARSIALPLSAVLLVRFGIGLIRDAGPLPDWLGLFPLVLIVPLGLLVGYALIITATEPPFYLAADVWSRYLLYLPGNLLAGIGFIRQWQGLNRLLPTKRKVLIASAITFFLNGLLAGAVVPPAPYGLAHLFNSEVLLAVTGIPVEVWRSVLGILMVFFVVSSLGVFEAERQQELAVMERAKAMAQENSLKVQQAARQEAETWTEVMVSTSRQIADMQDIENVLIEIVQQARLLLEADVAGLALWDEEKVNLQVKAIAVASGRIPVEDAVIESPLIIQALRQAVSSAFPDDVGAVKSYTWYCSAIDDLIRATAIVPLILNKDAVGGIWVGRKESNPFHQNNLSGLERLGAQAVIALEHAIMTSRLQSVAVMEERARIAREMHDSLAQILGYLGVEMQALEAMVRQNDPAEVIAEIRNVRENVKLAQQDVRENILSLRTTLSTEAGVITALDEYIQEFGIQTSIRAQLCCDFSGPLRLSPIAETQMVRIIQEALTNVRKHARAENVQIHLTKSTSCLLVTVADDGAGFESAPAKGHYGLITMRERAESVGGGLTVTSFPGEGTQVELWLPIFE